MPSETEFVSDALTFLSEIGADISGVTATTDLVESGVLDSLATLAFLDFLENRNGKEIDVDSLTVESISSLQSAYAFVFSREQV